MDNKIRIYTYQYISIYIYINTDKKETEIDKVFSTYIFLHWIQEDMTRYTEYRYKQTEIDIDDIKKDRHPHIYMRCAFCSCVSVIIPNECRSQLFCCETLIEGNIRYSSPNGSLARPLMNLAIRRQREYMSFKTRF